MLSIIICTLNEEHYLPKLLDSIIQQKTKFDYEVLVVDGGSSDNTAQVVMNYEDELMADEYFEDNLLKMQIGENGICVVLKNDLYLIPSERGISLQRNKGAQFAKYDYLLFLDADVVLPEGFLQNALTEIVEKDIEVAGTQIFAAEPSLFYRFVYWTYSNTYYKIVRWFNPVVHGCSIFVTQDIHQKIGGFKQGIMFEDFKYGSDAAAFYRPRLLKSTFVRTSARRFYHATPRSIFELLRGAVKSFFQSGIKNEDFTAFHTLSGNHEMPRY